MNFKKYNLWGRVWTRVEKWNLWGRVPDDNYSNTQSPPPTINEL